MTPIPSPAVLKREMPLSEKERQFIASSRGCAMRILEQKERRLACILGPCSIHDIDSALDYATRLKGLSAEMDPSFFPVMRVFCEKPRTRAGWKGMIYDPDLDGSDNVVKGLRQARSLLLTLAQMEIPTATEFLDPLIAPYFDDLITWGFIGARTSASQPHRQLASSLPFPVGFKNSVYGEINAALHGIYNARGPHVYFGINDAGSISALRSHGNPWTHLVLRGSETGPNYDKHSIQRALTDLREQNLEPRVLIDCSHGNSGKDHTRQPDVFHDVMRQVEAGTKGIVGVMLESHLVSGNQRHSEDPQSLSYGLSITDSCLGWEETEELLAYSLPTSMSSVQN